MTSRTASNGDATPWSQRVVLVTGGTGGIGEHTAAGLARHGATVLVTGRDERRGVDTVHRLRRTTGNQDVHLLVADAARQDDVRALAEQVLSRYPTLDVLVNNVGGLYAERRIGVDGVELTWAVNHLAPFLLTALLLPRLHAAAAGRVINVNSSVHRFGFAALNPDDLDGRHEDDAPWRGMMAYGRAKRADLIATMELARRLNGTSVTVTAVDPGGTSTDLNGSITRAMLPQPMRAAWPLFRLSQRRQQGPERGAAASLSAATAASGVGHAQLLGSTGKPIRTRPEITDPHQARRVWQHAHHLTGLPTSTTPA